MKRFLVLAAILVPTAAFAQLAGQPTTPLTNPGFDEAIGKAPPPQQEPSPQRIGKRLSTRPKGTQRIQSRIENAKPADHTESEAR